MAKLVVSWVDGKASVAEIGEMCGMGDDMARRIVGDLARRGVVDVPGFEAEGGSAGASRVSSSPPPAGLVADVETVYVKIEKANFYDLLGVGPDADRKVLRSAYFTLSKKFHPDRGFGKDEGDMRRKMEVIFRRMTQAYDVLSNNNQRKEYDDYIADQLEVWRIEKQLNDALALEKEIGTKSSEPPAPGSPNEPPSSGARGTRPITGKRRRKPKPSAAPREAVRSTPSIPARDPRHDARRREWKRQRAKSALKRSLKQFTSSRPAPAVRIADNLEQAKIAIELEKYSEATRLLEDVLKSDSKNEQARELLGRAKSGAVKALAAGYIRQGLYERRQGDTQRARQNFEKALEADATNIEARYQIADLLLELRMELPRALTLCREVVGMGGQRARYFATLGELLLLAKQADRAGEAFSKAIALEPDNREYRKRLKACKV
jgi:curved DNA-binding protein CbpA